jgi:hypothetical protein
MVESYIRLVTNPKTGEKFTSVSEALNLLRNEFKKRGGKDKQETQEKKVKGKTGKTIVVPN